MAYSNIAESLLEMHYFRVLVDRYKQLLGADIEVFKPATTAEHWYGFDQAFFTADAPKPTVIEDLRQFIQTGAQPRFTSFRAFLLQFKVVEIARKRSALSPPGWSAPYYRSELYLEPNRTTGISQHEALHRLSGLSGAFVAYACPMIFEEGEVLNQPKLSDVRFVDVSSSPVGWLTTERHFIAFQRQTSPPMWCSQPVPGKELTLEQIFERTRPMKTQTLVTYLSEIRRVLAHTPKAEEQQDLLGYDEQRNLNPPNVFPASLSIVAELSPEKQSRR